MSSHSRVLLYNVSDDLRKEICELGSPSGRKEDEEQKNYPAMDNHINLKENTLVRFSCSLCNRTFSSLEEQREHYHSQSHLQKLKSDNSDDSDSDDDLANVVDEGCLLTITLPSSRITVYKRLVESGFTNREMNLSQIASHLDGHFCILLYRSGYFIMGIYERGKLLVSFHEKRYTTRRKQGGAQRKKDNSSGKAISMGARLRRHNEELMRDFVRKTIRENHDAIMSCSAVFIGTTKLNFSLFFEEGCLDRESPKIRKVPMFFQRPNLTEMNRVYLRLATVVLSPLDASPRPFSPSPSVEEKTEVSPAESIDLPVDQSVIEVVDKTILDDTQLDASYVEFWKAVSEGNLTHLGKVLTDHPQYNYLWNEDGETALHIATKTDNPEMIRLLLTYGSDPTVRDDYERLPYSLCPTKTARQAYQEYRVGHPDQYNWNASAVPEPLTEEQLQHQKEKQRERRKRQKERKKEKQKEKQKETEKEAQEEEPVDVKKVNESFTTPAKQKLSVSEQLKLTNQLHRLASRLQVNYRTLVSYLSQDSGSMVEKAQNLENLLDSGEIPIEVILENMVGFGYCFCSIQYNETHNQKVYIQLKSVWKTIHKLLHQ